MDGVSGAFLFREEQPLLIYKMKRGCPRAKQCYWMWMLRALSQLFLQGRRSRYRAAILNDLMCREARL
jgi:hypothetical protein